MGKPAQACFKRDSDLLLTLFGGTAREQSDYGDLYIRDVRECLDRKLVEGNDTTAYEQHRKQQREQGLMQRERNNPLDHYLSPFLSSSALRRIVPSLTMRSPTLSPEINRSRPASPGSTSTF